MAFKIELARIFKCDVVDCKKEVVFRKSYIHVAEARDDMWSGAPKGWMDASVEGRYLLVCPKHLPAPEEKSGE